MRAKMWLVVRSLLVASLLLSLVGCMGGWLNQSNRPTLYLGKPVISNGQGELTVSVTNMPDGGLAAIQVDLGGMTYDPEKISDLKVAGLNGFIVLKSEFAEGKGHFMLIDILSGVENGSILKLTFSAHGNVTVGDIVLSKDKIKLVSDAVATIDTWNLPAYYAE